MHAHLEETICHVNGGPNLPFGTVIQDVIDARQGMGVRNSVFV